MVLVRCPCTILKHVLGTTATVHAANYDGSIAFGYYTIYDAETFIPIREMPLQSGVLAVSDADSILYIYHENTQRIYMYDFSHLQ